MTLSCNKEVVFLINLRKCAVIGCGNVGATIAYALMQKGLYSEMVLIDVNHEKAVGEAADLTHGLPFLRPMQIYAGDRKSTRLNSSHS